jgi:hypothetical protein
MIALGSTAGSLDALTVALTASDDMDELSHTMAKLAGIRQALESLVNVNVSRNRSAGEVKTRSNFRSDEVQHYFMQVAKHLETLRTLMPGLYGIFTTSRPCPKSR